MVGGRRFRPSVAVVNGHRFRPTFGHLEVTSMSIVIGTATIWQQSELSVEERNPESVVECKSVSLRIDGYCCMNVHVPTSFRRETRPFVLRDEKRQSVFLRCYQADAWFLVLERQNVFLWCYHVNPLFFVLQDS